jgi:prepilin-type N-terminal cleavage/methylation domain-containing protein
MILAKRRPGFSLLEVMVVIVVMSIIMMMATSMLLNLFRLETAEAGAHDRLMSQSALADQFREDVAAASAAPPQGPAKDGDEPPLQADKHTLILKTDGDRYIAYRWNKGELERIETVVDQETRRVMPVGGDNITVEFLRQDKIHRLRLIASGKGGTSVLDIAAALGGERR